jgi:hypothetical protein
VGIAEKPSEVVEDRMRHRLEADRAIALARRLIGKRSEAVVLPPEIVPAVHSMGDPHPPFPCRPDKTPVTQ